MGGFLRLFNSKQALRQPGIKSMNQKTWFWPLPLWPYVSSSCVLEASRRPESCVHLEKSQGINIPSPFQKMSSLKSESVSCSVVSDSLRPHGLQPAMLLCQWKFSGKNTRVGSHSLLQGIFLAQGQNLGFLHCRQIFYHLSHQGSPFSAPFRMCPPLGP